MPEVILYTQPGCGACDQEKQFLDDKGVPYTEKDITQDTDAMQHMVKMNAMATPTTVIDQKEVLVGFDPDKLSELLGL